MAQDRLLSMRPMREADVPFVLGLGRLSHVRAAVHAPPRKRVAAALADPRLGTYIVTEHRSAVGHLVLDEPDDPWLVELRWLAACQQGRGIGTFIVEWALQHIFGNLHAHRAYLEVVAGNQGARRLYERFGFVQEGIFRDGYRHEPGGTYEDLVAYGMLASERLTGPLRPAMAPARVGARLADRLGNELA